MARPLNRNRSTPFGGINLGNDVLVFTNDGAPTDGTSGTGFGKAGPGSICVDFTNKKAYINTGTQASPTWTVIGSQS